MYLYIHIDRCVHINGKTSLKTSATHKSNRDEIFPIVLSESVLRVFGWACMLGTRQFKAR